VRDSREGDALFVGFARRTSRPVRRRSREPTTAFDTSRTHDDTITMRFSLDQAAILATLCCALACAPAGGPTPEHAPNATSRATMWHCPMHPSYRSDRPGKCPICNMDLVPLGDETERAAPDLIAGRAPVTISPERQGLAGIRTSTVVREAFSRTIRASARVDVDERKLARVSAKFGGWIEQLFVKSVGETVKKGDPLLSIWSPELYEAQKSYLISRSIDGANGDAEIARKKLLAWDMTEEQIRALEGRSDPERLTTILAKVDGVVTRRDAIAGGSVEPGKMLYEIADLSNAWVLADVFETEIPFVSVGQEATVVLDSRPGERMRGRVGYVYPLLDEVARTERVRIEIENAGGVLAPGMYATAWIARDLGPQIVVDDDAVLDTGVRQLVFVESSPDRFEPREIELGPRSGGRAVVKKGLAPGEKVVRSANFLVDSESRLRAALVQHGPEQHAHH
jgi:multidrug efflux pump subunit AcrA (membrane-fusion protein)